MDKRVSRLPASAAAAAGILLAVSMAACGNSQEKVEKQESAPSTVQAELSAMPAAAAPTVPAEPAPTASVTHLPKIRPVPPTQTAVATAAFLGMIIAMDHDNEDELMAAGKILAACTGPDTLPARDWLTGALWLLDRKSDKTNAFLQMARSVWPKDAPLLYCQTETLAQSGHGQEALVLISQYMAEHPDDPQAILQKGIILSQIGQPAAAVTALETTKAKDRTPTFEYYLARALIDAGRQDDGMRHLRSALRQRPEFTEALATLAYMQERQGDIKDAIQTYDKLLRSGGVDRKEVCLRIISLCIRSGRTDSALEYYRKGPQETGFRLQCASIFAQFKHFLQAERILKEAAQDPNAPGEVFLFLADLVFEQNRDLKAAQEWLAHIPADNPLAPRRLLALARYQAQSGLLDESLKSIASYRGLYPDDPDAWEIEIRVLASQKKKDAALKAAEKAVQAWPKSEDLLYLYGSLLAEMDRKAQAFAVMEKIIAVNPNNWQALNYIGYTLADENREIPRSLELLDRANKLAPKKFFILDSLAWACYRAHRLEEALSYIREAISLNAGGDPTLYEHLGDIARAKGLTGEARKAYTKALEKNPPTASDIKRKLEALQGTTAPIK